jgi:hypothetical protein
MYAQLFFSTLCLCGVTYLVISSPLFANLFLNIISGIIAAFIFPLLPVLKERGIQLMATSKNEMNKFTSDFRRFVAPVFMERDSELSECHSLPQRIKVLFLFSGPIIRTMVGTASLLVADRVSRIWKSKSE